MANCAIVGVNWGDEGKGRMVDLLTQTYDVVVRYQGGGNAGLFLPAFALPASFHASRLLWRHATKRMQ